MKWLETKLAEAKQHNDKVWLIFHIPPGIDGFSTSHPKGGGPNKIVWMWKPNDTEEFAKLLSEYHDTVTVSLAGHEHMDDFRLISHSLVLCAPGLSPVVGQNPAFRVAAFGPDGTIRDEKTYYLSNLETASGTTGADWKLEYSFAGTWNARRLDFKNFSRMYDEMAAKPAPREQWATWYSVSRQELSAQSSKKFAWLFCASGNATEETYKACIERMNGVSAE